MCTKLHVCYSALHPLQKTVNHHQLCAFLLSGPSTPSAFSHPLDAFLTATTEHIKLSVKCAPCGQFNVITRFTVKGNHTNRVSNQGFPEGENQGNLDSGHPGFQG